MALTPGTRFGAYDILTLLGAGGMGEVFQAKDTRLKRDVALKVLPDRVAQAADRIARFQREAELLASLNHPNIAGIYGIEESNGVRALVLELVEGPTLADRVAKGPIPLDEALAIARQIADALDAAHERGIVHRDLKPANIKITPGGVVKVLDFGLAKVQRADGSAVPTLAPTISVDGTSDGIVLGTAAYMSPEQARGHAVDKRTDMWAFGCVLYEMLTGRVAFKATTLSDTLVCVLERNPDWTALPATVPPGAHGLMRRCLEKDSRRRLRDIGDVRLELESLQHACGGRASATTSPHASIAVLPFANLSADKENEYFGDGLAEEIINALTQVAGLRVIARTSAFAFKDRQEDVRRIAEMLGVANILQGSVRRAGQRIRVTTQLITGADATQVWSNRYDREITDVFAVQDEIAQAVVDALRDRLGMPVTKRIVQRQTADIEAYCLYVQGRHHFSNFEPDEMDQGRRLFEEALAVDPTYALPFVDLAHYYWVNTMTTRVSPIEGTTKAMQAVERALTLDDTLGEAVGFLGRFMALYEYRWADALDELERAMEMNPASTLTPQGQAVVFTALNRLSEAVRQQEHALKADPFSPLNQYFMTRLLVYSGDYEKAAKHAQQAMELAPQSWIANAALGLVDLYAGRISGALRALETAKRTAPAGFVTSGWRGCAYVRAGETGKAERLLEELQKMASPVPAAMIHAELGNTDAAFEQLQAATRRRDFQLYSLQVDPAFDSLRSESRYEDLLGSMKLPG